jgi:hypothetical protein
MLQPPSSFELTRSNGTAGAEFATELTRYFQEDLEPGFRQHLLLQLQDPFAKNGNGGFRLSPLWTGLGTLGLIVFCVFVYFNVLRL